MTNNQEKRNLFLENGINQTKCFNFSECRNLKSWNIDTRKNEPLAAEQIKMIFCKKCINSLRYGTKISLNEQVDHLCQ